MYTFLYASIPLILVLACCTNGTFSWKSLVPPVVFGFLVGFGFAFAEKFMIFNEYVWTEKHLSSILHLWIFSGILPLLICVFLFSLFDRSSMSYKAESIGPMMLVFYSIMVPFTVMNGSDHLSSFMIFGKPLLYAGMAVCFSIFAGLAVSFTNKRLYPFAVIFALVFVAVTFVPPVVEAQWYYSGSGLYTLVSIAFCGASVFVYLFLNIARSIGKKSSK